MNRLRRWWHDLTFRGRGRPDTPPRHPAPPGRIIPPQGGTGVRGPATVRQSAAYTYRIQDGDLTVEYGFATFAEMTRFLSNPTSAVATPEG
jgi:hypothetical protein